MLALQFKKLVLNKNPWWLRIKLVEMISFHKIVSQQSKKSHEPATRLQNLWIIYRSFEKCQILAPMETKASQSGGLKMCFRGWFCLFSPSNDNLLGFTSFHLASFLYVPVPQSETLSLIYSFLLADPASIFAKKNTDYFSSYSKFIPNFNNVPVYVTLCVILFSVIIIHEFTREKWTEVKTPEKISCRGRNKWTDLTWTQSWRIIHMKENMTWNKLSRTSIPSTQNSNQQEMKHIASKQLNRWTKNKCHMRNSTRINRPWAELIQAGHEQNSHRRTWKTLKWAGGHGEDMSRSHMSRTRKNTWAQDEQNSQNSQEQNMHWTHMSRTWKETYEKNIKENQMRRA